MNQSSDQWITEQIQVKTLQPVNSWLFTWGGVWRQRGNESEDLTQQPVRSICRTSISRKIFTASLIHKHFKPWGKQKKCTFLQGYFSFSRDFLNSCCVVPYWNTYYKATHIGHKIKTFFSCFYCDGAACNIIFLFVFRGRAKPTGWGLVDRSKRQ